MPIESRNGHVQRVMIDMTRLRCLHCGLGQFSLHLGRALARAPKSAISPEFLLPFRNRRLLAKLGLPGMGAYPWMKERYQQSYRPWIRGLLPPVPRYALWHATTQYTRFLPLDERVPLLLTIHDLNFLREKPPSAWERNLRRVQNVIDRAQAVTTISNFVAKEIRNYLDLRGKPLRVIYNGLIAEDYPDAKRPPFVDGGPFLFAIGDISPKKNFHVLIHLLGPLQQYRLIIAGNDRTPYAAQIRRYAAEAGVAGRVVLPGVVNDATRYWLYKNCTAFLFPSLTEGFGLPVIEAMQFGKPVFLSAATSLPEVAGPMAFYFRSFEPEPMVRVFCEGMAAYAAAANYPARLIARARHFSWDKAAAEYLVQYDEILEGTQGRYRRAVA